MEKRLNESEFRFMDVLWDVEPVTSMELVRLCNERLGWKKSTTYTVIHHLTEKGFVVSEKTVVRTLVNRDEVQRQESGDLLEKQFRGNLPAFVSALLRGRTLTEEEAEAIWRMIEEAKE